MRLQTFARSMLAVIVAAGSLTLTATAHDNSEEAFQNLVSQRGPALVKVRFLLKIQLGGALASMGNQEAEQEVGGLMIEPDGLILVSNTQFGGFTSLMRKLAGDAANDITAIPTDIKVLIGDDTEGVEAKLLARDSELDLAWLKITEPAAEPYEHVKITESAKPVRGQDLLAMYRMGKFFDRVLMVTKINIGAMTTRPRNLYLSNGLSDATSMGVPIFTLDGKFVGVSILQFPDADAADDSPFSPFGSLGDVTNGLILPAEQIVKATERAMETVRAAESEEAEIPEEATADTDAATESEESDE